MATELILIRHGNAIRIQGDYVHAPLTTLGVQQADLTGQYLHAQPPLSGFYSSPLRRAKETAAHIGAKIGMTPEEKNGIREIEGFEVPALAILEALSIFDLLEDYLDTHVGKPLRWPVEGRVAKATIEMVTAHPNQRIAAVAHSGMISAVLAWAFPEQRLKWWSTMVGNCSLTRLRIEGTAIELIAVNETQHLSPELTTVQPPAPAVQLTKTVVKTVTRRPTATKSI